jgi:hypothetical protein
MVDSVHQHGYCRSFQQGAFAESGLIRSFAEGIEDMDMRDIEKYSSAYTLSDLEMA